MNILPVEKETDKRVTPKTQQIEQEHGKIAGVDLELRRRLALQTLRQDPNEEHLWEALLAFQKAEFSTYSGLTFTYEIRKGKSGAYTKELWIDRREKSKSLAWSSIRLALHSIDEVGEEVPRPKALGDIRGVTYIYAIFCRFGLIRMPHPLTDSSRKDTAGMVE